MTETASTRGLGELRTWLAEDGLIDAETAELIPLTGGVSSDVVLVRTPQCTFVAKRALPKLRVQDDWYAGTERNRYEHQYITAARAIVPEAFPEVLHANDRRGYFCMTWLGEGWENWKTRLMRGVAEVAIAETAASSLGRIHRQTARRSELAKQFDTLKNFHELRIEPYLLTTAERHPKLADHFHRETERLAASRQCLVHGDFSPKNMLIRDGRVVVLDCEVAWYGAPSFDLAFLLNHLALKTVYRFPHHGTIAPLLPAAWEAYFNARPLAPAQREQLQLDTLRLMLMLLLARIDGKSPVEYMEDFPERKDVVRRFVYRYLPKWNDTDPRRLLRALVQSIPADT
jgi:aminoglycoside phosphotransferase (APT) family kinase protein